MDGQDETGETDEIEVEEMSEEEMKEMSKDGLRACITVEYRRFLLLFAKNFLPSTLNEGKSKLLSTYTTTTLEAFAVVLYVNNYRKQVYAFVLALRIHVGVHHVEWYQRYNR
jgi:hypothetical protein